MIDPMPGSLENDIYKNRLEKLTDGCLLVAEENLEDPNFTASVVLICIHNRDGAFGLVLNRPTHMPLSEVFDVDVALRLQRRKIYIGGPVGQDSLQILQITDNPVKNTAQVSPGVHLGGEWNCLEDILSADEKSTRLFLGYSGWGPSQLESEISLGAWDIFRVDLAGLLKSPEENLTGDLLSVKEHVGKFEV